MNGELWEGRLPWDVVGVCAKGKVHGQCLGYRSIARGAIVRDEFGVILRTERADDIRREGAGLVHHQLACEVIGICRGGIVGIVAVDVQGYKKGVISLVTVGGGDQEIITLGRGDAELVRGLVLDVGSVNHDDRHGVGIEMDKSRSERSKADETNTVGLSLDKVNVAITTFVDDGRLWEWRYRRPARNQHVTYESEALIMVPG